MLLLSGCNPGVNEDAEANGTKSEAISVSQETFETKSTTPETKEVEVKLDQYNDLMTYSFKNEAYKEAWESFKTIVSKVSIASLYTKNATGTTLKQFENLKLVDAEFEDGKFGENGILRMYTFKTKEPFSAEAGDEPGTANLILLFNNDVLSYVGVSNNSFLFTSDSILQREAVKKVAKIPFDFQEIAVEQPIVMSFGVTMVNDNLYEVISMPSGTPESLGVEYFAIVEGKFDYVTTKSIKDATENGIIETINALDRYIIEYSGEFYKLEAPEESSSVSGSESN